MIKRVLFLSMTMAIFFFCILCKSYGLKNNPGDELQAATEDGDIYDADIEPDHVDGEEESNNFLEQFEPFVKIQEQWDAFLQQSIANGPEIVPLPYFVSKYDPHLEDFFYGYIFALIWARSAGNIPDYLPYKNIKYDVYYPENMETILAKQASLIFANDEDDLFLWTDFSHNNVGERFLAACEHCLGSPLSEEKVNELYQKCAAKGQIVPIAKISSLEIDGLKFFKSKDCSVPSGVYGDYYNSGQYDWPDYFANDAIYYQPCIGAFLHGHAKDDVGNTLAEGWFFPKAVADFEEIPFPDSARDKEFGDVRNRNGFPRGQYTLTRYTFEEGIGMYLGNTPLWLFKKQELNYFLTEFSAIDLIGRHKFPVCAKIGEELQTPCILQKQKPFIFFDMEANKLYSVSAIDTSVPDLDEHYLRRNLFETSHFGRIDRPGHIARNLINFFIQAEEYGVYGNIENLSAPWYSYEVYGTIRTRCRANIIGLTDDYVLVVPDQGYIQLGYPSSEFYNTLKAANLDEILNFSHEWFEDEHFVITGGIEERNQQ